MSSFKTYHPIVNFGFFAAVIGCTFLWMHPVFLVISVSAAFVYSLLLKGMRALRFNLLFALPMLVVIALLNPLFVHQGMTMLFYTNDNPITLEAIVYGIAAAVMLVAVLLWFTCYNEVVTSDKFLYLFGKVLPSLALLLSMTLRLIPRLKTQVSRIAYAQRAIGMGTDTGSLRQRVRHGMRILSILITWALENAVETADSMKARGYGLHGRTSFSIFRFNWRDAVCLIGILAAVMVCVLGQIFGATYVQYYPYIKWAAWPSLAGIAAVYAALCFLPVILELWEGYKWRSLKSTV